MNAISKPVEEKSRRFWWHWQNLNDRKDGTQASGLRHGRCWWHFRSRNKRPGPDICFTWLLWGSFCGIGADIDDEDLTLQIAFPPLAFWLSFSTNFWLIDVLAPRKVLGPQYPDTIVIDERECSLRIHSGSVWLKFWGPRDEWVKADPWWKRGVNFSINPFEWRHMRHEVRTQSPNPDQHLSGPPFAKWAPYVGSWEHDKQPDGRELFTYPYRYVLNNGTTQDRTATVYVDRMAWRPRCLQWTSLFEKERTSIDVTFSDEVGERTGSWKGGCIGCSWELRPGELPEEALRRMEKERKFT